MKRQTITCSRCGKKFLAGKGHNARTCGKLKSHPKLNTKTSPNAPQGSRPPTTHKTPTGTKQTITFSDIDLELVTSQRQGRALPSEGLKGIGFTIESGKARPILINRNGEKSTLAKEVATQYDHIVVSGKTCYFNEEGELHREGQPAVQFPNGGEEWWVNGKLHRNDGPTRTIFHTQQANTPAYLKPKGKGDIGRMREWRVEGKHHRLNGPAVEWPDGNEEWWVEGKRSDSPELCEKATRADLTDADFYELCSHEDKIVRQVAANNPECPPEWRTLANLKNI